MDSELASIPPAQRKELLKSMLNGPAFALFCERWDQRVKEQIDKKIFDPETDPTQTHQLKLVRKEVTGTGHPRDIVETMIRAISNEREKTQT